jgi:MobA/MobL family
MAIQYARARYIKRSEGGSAVRQACYNARLKMVSERTGEEFDWRRKHGTLEHHAVLLPPNCPMRLAESSMLWNSAEAAEKRKDAQVAREVILALPADREITRAHRLEMVRGFAEQHFVSKGLAVQINLHRPHRAETGEETKNYHAHLLITTRRLEGEAFSAKKARDLDPQVRSIGQRPIVAEGELWGEVWRDYQNNYFGSHGLEIAVDPVAPVPGEHLGPNHFRNPDSERSRDAAARLEANAEAARDPTVVHDRLKSRDQVIDDRALDRFLTKHVRDPQERAAVKEKVFDWERERLTKAAFADHVPSGWRLATVEDVARELSPEYADRIKYDKRLRDVIARTEKGLQHREGIARGRENGIGLRWWRMNLAQKTLHVTGVWRDERLKQYERDAARAWRSHHRLAVRRGALTGQLAVNRRLAAAVLEKIRPEAERVLSERQQQAEVARLALAAIREASPDLGFERERTRDDDRGFGRERSRGSDHGLGFSRGRGRGR